jgi:hypothetical protein
VRVPVRNGAYYVETLSLRTRRRRSESGRFEWDNEIFKVEMEIDLYSIMHQLADKAALSKGKRARYMSGKIRVKVSTPAKQSR